MGRERTRLTERLDGADRRVAEHPVAPIFLERRSSRAFSGEPIPEEAMFSLFEAGGGRRPLTILGSGDSSPPSGTSWRGT